MKGSLKLVAPLLVALGAAACSAGGSSSIPSGQMGMQAIPAWQATHAAHAACSGSRDHQAQCDVLISNKGATPNISGITAANMEAAYKLPITKGSGANVYIVDAYDNPNVESDFAAYRSGMGLPAGTLNKYNQNGQMSGYPQGSTGWGVEIDLDVEMVSASCPLCTVNLIEANSSSWSDLETAEKEAVTLGGTIVTNSYSGTGGSESDYDTSGVTYLASAGDSRYGLIDPATFDSVVAIGGTELSATTQNKRGWNEVIWPDSGGGCSSTDEPKPTWQKDPSCSYRTGNDVSAQANTNTAEYDTYGEGGWFEVGGTSVASPLIAGMYALAGNSTKQDGGENLWKLKKKKLKKEIWAITSGSDGSCGGSYLCTAGTGQFGQYSGPGGWGSPDGVKAL